MKESDRWWNRAKNQRRVENVNLCNGSRVNGKPLFEGQPRSAKQNDMEGKIKRRELFKKSIPWVMGVVAGATGAGVQEQVMDEGRLTTLEIQVENHGKILGIHSRVLLSHDMKLKS